MIEITNAQFPKKIIWGDGGCEYELNAIKSY